MAAVCTTTECTSVYVIQKSEFYQQREQAVELAIRREARPIRPPGPTHYQFLDSVLYQIDRISLSFRILSLDG